MRICSRRRTLARMVLSLLALQLLPGCGGADRPPPNYYTGPMESKGSQGPQNAPRGTEPAQ